MGNGLPLKDGVMVLLLLMKMTRTAKIMIPQGAKELWLVVTGAPSEHRNHVWDDKPDNDENFPYKVKFTNTTIQ
jgi:hypothetical protein